MKDVFAPSVVTRTARAPARPPCLPLKSSPSLPRHHPSTLSMFPVYNFCPNNTDLVDASLVDPSLHPYRQHPLDDPAQPIQPTLSLGYSYLDNPYLAIPQQLNSPVPLHRPRPQSDPARPPTPVQDTSLSFTPISQQLVYPATRHIVPSPPVPHGADSTPPCMLDYYAATSQQLFPTPSELLSNINHRQQPCQHDVPESRPYIQPPPPPPQTSRQQSPDDSSPAPLHSVLNKTESQRKARQRAIAEEIGFTPTDPYVFRTPFSRSYSNSWHQGYHLLARKKTSLPRVSGTMRPLPSRAAPTRADGTTSTRTGLDIPRPVFSQHSHSPRAYAEYQQDSARGHTCRGTSGRLEHSSAPF